MIVCQRCSKENQDHYKFCLGCGAEISTPSPGDSVGMMKTMMADSSAITGNPPQGPPPGVGLPNNQQAFAPRPLVAPQAVVPQAVVPQAVVPQAVVPQAVVPQAVAPRPVASPAKIITCQKCQAEIPPNFKFCGVCGSPIQDEPAPPEATTLPGIRATMTLIRPDGTEGGTHALHEGVNPLGRSHGAIFESDGYLSPTHAELAINRSGIHCITDCASLNGVFVRMTEEEELVPGQIIRIGQELLRFDRIGDATSSPDGTEVMGSPNPGYWGRITVIIADNADGAAFPLLGESITMGRENGDINFPDDGYVSGLHAQVVSRGSKVYLSDRGSSNGTFMKVSGTRNLANNSFVLLGQQLFRISVQ